MKEEKYIPGFVPATLLGMVIFAVTKDSVYAVFTGLISWLLFGPTALSFKKQKGK